MNKSTAIPQAITHNETRGARRVCGAADVAGDFESSTGNPANPQRRPASQNQPGHQPGKKPEQAYYLMVQFPNGHSYAWTYVKSTRDEVKRMLGRCAADPNHPLTWLQAAQLTKLMRAQEITEQWGEAGSLLDDESTDGGWDYTNDALDQREDD